MTDNDDEMMVAVAGGRELAAAAGFEDAQAEFAAELFELAKARGMNLVGPGGLLAGVTKRILELGLEAEMTEHLGYEKHAVEGRNGVNSRNGTRAKTVITEIGPIDIEVPRDRDGTFCPETVAKR